MKRLIAITITLCSTFAIGQQKNAPKLIVGIVVDQMCYEYLYRYQAKFSDGGFQKLMRKGTNCRNANYNYVPTFTGPGRASIYTGTTPSNHGIVANEWFDRESGEVINCVADSSVTSVGTVSSAGLCSPKNLKANTITDQLKLTYTNAKVVSMSIKNRGAILPGGHLSDGSYWYDYSTGDFVTSSYFEDQLPNWVTNFNGKKYAEKYMSGVWNTIQDIATYTESGPDDSPYEHLLPGKTKPVFPYNLKKMTEEEGVTASSIFPYTPFANTFLADFAIASIDGEGLGQDDQTDMLCISFSTPDIIGHAFGPYSVEIEDTYIRLDLEIEKLIKALERKVGKKNFTLFLTADHAVVPVPQYLTDKNLPGGYFFIDPNLTMLKNKMIERYGQDLILEQENLNVYLDHDSIAILKLDRDEVIAFAAAEIQDWEGVKRVFRADQLYNPSASDEWMQKVSKGFHHAESGDIIFMLEPGYLPKSKDSESARKGTSHGSAYSYDAHVPLLWYGHGIPKQEVFRQINITDISATLTHLLNLQNVNAITGRPILEILDKQ
ncbi:MAG: alkaline phosphatase family protein [Crocinitomicaceae bacterium]|nr:alkaline phosphatase family protein [Crocinitomicaceae bacterium]